MSRVSVPDFHVSHFHVSHSGAEFSHLAFSVAPKKSRVVAKFRYVFLLIWHGLSNNEIIIKRQFNKAH